MTEPLVQFVFEDMEDLGMEIKWDHLDKCGSSDRGVLAIYAVARAQELIKISDEFRDLDPSEVVLRVKHARNYKRLTGIAAAALLQACQSLSHGDARDACVMAAYAVVIHHARDIEWLWNAWACSYDQWIKMQLENEIAWQSSVI